jgi:hypothetical protein
MGGHVRVAGPAGDGLLPAFAGLPEGREGIAVPLTVGAEPVAVLYADQGRASDPAPAWKDAIQILARHASACLAFLTAARTAQAMDLIAGEPRPGADDSASEDPQESARRYARLLVSEIKLYNEASVRVGREKRDLRTRLRMEIDHAREVFNERIPASVAGRDACFEEELVRTLAEGDPSRLG